MSSDTASEQETEPTLETEALPSGNVTSLKGGMLKEPESQDANTDPDAEAPQQLHWDSADDPG
jgi:hypothetical protein